MSKPPGIPKQLMRASHAAQDAAELLARASARDGAERDALIDAAVSEILVALRVIEQLTDDAPQRMAAE